MLKSPIGFFLVPTFPMIALASALDPLRIANRYVANKYEWKLISADGQSVPDANGSRLEVDCSIDEVHHLGAVFVCADHHAEQAATKRVVSWLKRLDRSGTVLGGIDSGAFTLARAGLLEKTCVTLHWEVIEAFRERFPNTYVTETLFESDKNRMTCAGGTAVIDMMLHTIAIDHGPEIAKRVAQHCMVDQIRKFSGLQQVALEHRTPSRHLKLVKALRIAQERLGSNNHINALELAPLVDTLARHLGRLFEKELGDTPGRYLLKLRLERARQLLRRTDISLLEIAVATGFASSSHFSRVYKRQYTLTPSEERRSLSPAKQLIVDAFFEPQSA